MCKHGSEELGFECHLNNWTKWQTWGKFKKMIVSMVTKEDFSAEMGAKVITFMICKMIFDYAGANFSQ